jgi:hypothetical protein
MDLGLIRSAPIMAASFAPHLTVLAVVSGFQTETGLVIFRSAENRRTAVAGNVTSIVHTEHAFDPTAQEAAR